MTPSSLKKMSGDQKRKEGNYASSKKTPWGRFTNHDLGLTLLPGSQIQRTDETRSRTAAESSPKNPGSNHVGISQQWKSFETEILPELPAQEKAVPDEPKSPISSPDLELDSPRFSDVTAQVSRERRFKRWASTKNSSGVIHHDVNSVAAPLYDEQIMGTGETRKANSCQPDCSSPRAMKWTTLGSSATNEMQDSKVSSESEAACKTQYKMHHDQDLSQINAIRSEKIEPSVATFGIPFCGTGGSSGSSKSNSCRQTTHISDTARARSLQNLDPEDLTVHDQPPSSSRSVSAQYWKHSCLLPDITEVNRSWTSHFPAKAKISRRAKLPALSLLAAPFTPGEDHRYPHRVNSLLTSTNLHSHTQFSSSYPSSSLPNSLSLSKAIDYPLDARKRSASLPNLSSTRTSMNMDFSHSMPTPPQEQPSSSICLPSSLSYHDNTPFHENTLDHSRGSVDTSFHAGNPSSQNWPPNSTYQLQHEISPSSRQDIGFAPRFDFSQALTQPFYHQHMTGPSVPRDDAMAAGRPQNSHQRLGFKPNYSHEELKSLVSNLDRETQRLRAENTKLQSRNTAMKKGFESLRHRKAGLTQQIQYYEQVVAQKDKQLEVMQQSGFTLQRQYKRMWDQHHRLLAAIRKEDGTGNPSLIAQQIRLNHLPSAVGTTSHGRQSNANVANASSQASAQPVFATANQNSANSTHHGSTRWVPPNQPFHVNASTVANNGQTSKHPVEKVPTDLVTIDLTDDSQPPSCLASRDERVFQMHQPSIQGECLPFKFPPGHYPHAQYPVHNQMSQSRLPPDQDSQGRDLEAMRIQREAIARMAEKPLSWLVGKHPFREGAETEQRVVLPNSGRYSQNDEEQDVHLAQSSEAVSVAPLPETATGQKTTKKAPKQPKVVLNAEAKKERAKGYRKTAAEKKKREKEIAKQLLQKENPLDNAMRAQKQDRRAAKAEKRWEQAHKPSEEFGPQQSQKTPDGRLYQEGIEVQQAIHQRSLVKVASDDQDSLFGDDEVEGADSPDADTVMHDDDDATAEQDAEAAMAAEIEAELEADADADAGRVSLFEQGDALGGQACVPTAIPNDDHGYHDFSSESEESEEE